MFNRANKATALLVAAAAVVSLVPATGVNAADYKRIESKDGTVYNAVAYKDGNFYIDGELEDKDEAAYYLSAGKYTELEDVDSNSDVETYGEKYTVVDGNYFVDLENGKVTDDDIKEENKDDAEIALRKKVKDKADDRYSNHDATVTLSSIAGNKFGEVWYQTTYTADGTTNGAANGALNVYTDAKGNYIDADYNLGKIRVTPTTGSSVNVENTDKEYDFGKANEDASVSKDDLSASVTAEKIIGQDSNNIYRVATITLKAKTNLITEVNGMSIYKATSSTDATNAVTAFTRADGTAITDANGVADVKFEVIQKISKAQASGDIDGAKYAKTVANYVLSNDKGVKEALAETTFSVVDGKVVAYNFDKDAETVDVKTVELKTSKGFYYTDITKADQEENVVAFDKDVDGNLWMIEGGFVYKFDNDEDWNKVYKVDGSMDELSVYNKDNMVVWNEKDEVYSVIGAKDDSVEPEKPEVTTGWVKNSDGTWTFVKEDGTKATGWLNNNGAWYFSNAAGIMQTGWINDNGTWYYTNASGAMLTGWQNVNGTWYFMQGSGAMKTGWINDNGTWYYTNASGAMQTGWLNDNGTWYYLDGSGKMLSNTTVNGYVLGANGAWIR
ncbi:N-acetylmuramoyl-L-alanine amidase family protein [Clostridium sp. ZBS2]|nr:N-acetylmuramoyl-L-alanine amidase family protein [Clostridium sp. ZBS2]